MLPMRLLRRHGDVGRTEPPPFEDPQARAVTLHYLDRVAEEVEAGLRDIEFDEVTLEDRITFVEYAVAWQIRLALRCARFDLAVKLREFGAQRIADLHQDVHGWRPVLPYGVPSGRGLDDPGG